MTEERKKNLEQIQLDKNWESLELPEVRENLDVPEEGLSTEEAARRLIHFGENKLPEAKKKSRLMMFLAQFNNALIYVLIVAAVITALMDHWVDTWVILGVVVINSIIGYIQEGKAEKALESIRSMLSETATVIRHGKKKTVNATELVPGDLVFLKAGDKVPADIRITDSANLRVEEASLTGEAEEVMKFDAPVPEGSDLGDRTSMVYMGTSVRNGSATGIVVATGTGTELGKINQLMTETKDTTTPLIRKINQFGIVLSFAIVAASILVFLYGYFLAGISAGDMFLAVIGIAVAAIPEGLPAIMTITLAIGVQKMARRNAIIRKLPSVETLGSVSVICSDKTGTLTKNEMTVVTLFTAREKYEVEGTGYQPEGRILQDGKAIDPMTEEDLQPMIWSAGFCNDSEITEENGTWNLVGAPTEGALKVLQMKAAGERGIPAASRIEAIPFDSNYKYMSTLYEIEGKRYVFVNGAPEKVLALCDSQWEGGQAVEAKPEYWYQSIEEGASLGQRMLGTAFKEVDLEKKTLSHEDLLDGMIFAGIFGLIDPPREEAIRAVEKCKKAGIVVKMITGDHALTAMSIGKEIGIGDGTLSMTGSEIEQLTDEELKEKVADCNIFARTTPEHKLRIVRALQEKGQVCAMTGDGVNDAPALKKADMGIAMGIKGTQVSKDASDMILVDDNFASIIHAVEVGRTIYDNLKKTLLFILPTNGAEALSIIIALFLGVTMPITAAQILWVNMITAVTLGLSLSFEPMEKNAMQRPPRDPNEPIISRYFGFRIGFVSVMVGTFTLMAFMVHVDQGYSLEWSRTVAVNTLVMGELFYLLNCKKIGESAIGKDLFNNKVILYVIAILVVFQLLFTYLPVMNLLFATTPISLESWAIPVGAGFVTFLVVEAEKWITRKFFAKPGTRGV